MEVSSKLLQLCPVKWGFELHVVNLWPELRCRLIVAHLLLLLLLVHLDRAAANEGGNKTMTEKKEKEEEENEKQKRQGKEIDAMKSRCEHKR